MPRSAGALLGAWLAVGLLVAPADEAAAQRSVRKERADRILGTPKVRDQRQAEMSVLRIRATKENDVVDTGSGIYLGKRASIGYFVTAFHVVRGAGTKIEAAFKPLPGRWFDAQLVAADEEADVAVLKVEYPPDEVRNEIVPFETGRAADLQESRRRGTGVTLEAAPGAPPGAGSVVVHSVAPGSEGSRAGVRSGDVLVAINGRRLSVPQDARDIYRNTAAGTPMHWAVRRNGVEMTLTLVRPADAPEDKGADSTVYSVGHPMGKAWSWQAGHLLAREADGRLFVSRGLAARGISGGPIFDRSYRLVGIALAESANWGEGLDIDAVLRRVEAWRIPFRFWQANDFCRRLLDVVAHGGSDFEELKTGAGRKNLVLNQQEWKASIDVSGNGLARVVRYDSRQYYAAEMGEGLPGDEAAQLVREVGRAVANCVDDPFVDEHDKDISIEWHEGGYWTGRERIVRIYRFYGSVELRVGF
jgi:S1-C subfamily serine protease